MTERVVRKVDEWGAIVPVRLDTDEQIRYEGSIFLRSPPSWFPSYGRLFLTTKRLIWIRYRWTLPLVTDVYLPLARIQGWEIRPTPWWWRWRPLFRAINRSIRVRTSSKTLEFLPRYTSEDADEWADALKTVLTEATVAIGEHGG